MLRDMGNKAKIAARTLSRSNSEQRNAVLAELAEKLWQERSYILTNNQIDIDAAREAGLSEAMVDRLTLNADRLKGMASDLRSVIELPDPVGEVYDEMTMPNKLRVAKVRVPLGVLGVIYESRPNVTIDIAGLAIKSGNAVILRGGSETLKSNNALVNLIHRALETNSFSKDTVQFINSPDRTLVKEMLELSESIDMIIPRGGAKLHEFCRENSKIPVMTGGIGICHLFVDESANLDQSIAVIKNAKIQRPTVCNALDTVLVHNEVARKFLPNMIDSLSAEGVKILVDPESMQYLEDGYKTRIGEAGPEDFDQEWLSLTVGIKVVDSLEDAVEHIYNHSTGHSDGILTENQDNALHFLSEVDSAAVYVNASTRFTDGGQLGLGAEVAISTQRLHARGPMGLQELMTYKWVIQGEYHTRR